MGCTPAVVQERVKTPFLVYNYEDSTLKPEEKTNIDFAKLDSEQLTKSRHFERFKKVDIPETTEMFGVAPAKM